MKAIIFNEHGSIDVLQYVTDLPKPKAGPRQVLIEVKAVALNHLDLFTRAGIPGLSLEMPHVLGSDISGIVVEKGADVSEEIEIGTRVIVDPGVNCGVCEFCISGQESLCIKYGILGEHYSGGYREFMAIDAHKAIPIPETSKLSFEEAAAAPLTFMTAWRLLMTKARLRAGEDVLIIGIGGGVAIAAFQIAKLSGARVFVTSSSDKKLEKARKLGADYLINHADSPDYHREIWKLTNKRGVDVVVDSVGEATWAKSLRSLRKGGRLVTCGATTGPNAVTNLNLVFWKQLEILGSTMASRSELETVLQLVWDGRLKPVVDRILPLSSAKEAHEILESGEQFGKIVLTP
ncbi:MAG: zinc-binding dehydrogenase [Candidatus Thorarchaeota archaeon]|jgi:NADPH2:quinone reductase